jgi:hypothetical protein
MDNEEVKVEEGMEMPAEEATETMPAEETPAAE